MSHMMQPQIVLLREGTDTSQGKGQLISNINACQAVADSIRSTLGPRGMDKLVFDGHASRGLAQTATCGWLFSTGSQLWFLADGLIPMHLVTVRMVVHRVGDPNLVEPLNFTFISKIE